MAYPVSTSIHLYFDEALTLNEQIEKHTAAGFRYLDFNFLNSMIPKIIYIESFLCYN